MSHHESSPKGEKVTLASALGIFMLALLEAFGLLGVFDRMAKHFENNGALMPAGGGAH